MHPAHKYKLTVITLSHGLKCDHLQSYKAVLTVMLLLSVELGFFLNIYIYMYTHIHTYIHIYIHTHLFTSMLHYS